MTDVLNRYAITRAWVEATKNTTPGIWRTEFSQKMDFENEDWILYAGDRNICSGNYYSCPGIEEEGDARFCVIARNTAETIQQALAIALETLSETTAPDHPVWAKLERLLGDENTTETTR